MKFSWRRVMAVLLSALFFIDSVLPVSCARAAVTSPLSSAFVDLSAAFCPPMVRGLSVDPQDPLRFDFIVDSGDRDLTGVAFEEESKKLIRYFLAALAVPEKELWVNLSPYEKDRMIPPVLGGTGMGVDMLAQDYLLKKMTASLLYPDAEPGKEFWSRVYARAHELFGTTDIPVDAFNKVWIAPDKAVVYERKGRVLVVERHLKVMFESDYMAMSHQKGAAESFAPAKGEAMPGQRGVAESFAPAKGGPAREILRDVIIPILEKEVNSGENFAALRQVYNAVILAAWYKKRMQDTFLARAYADAGRIKGIDADDPELKERIYAQYLETFRKGVFDLIREEYDEVSGHDVPRKYSSGGLSVGAASVSDLVVLTGDMSELPQKVRSAMDRPESAFGHDRRVSWRAIAPRDGQDAAEKTMTDPRAGAFLPVNDVAAFPGEASSRGFFKYWEAPPQEYLTYLDRFSANYGYPRRDLEHPPVYTAPTVLGAVRNEKNPQGWAHPDLDEPDLTPEQRRSLEASVYEDVMRWAPWIRFENGRPVNDLKTGMKGRGKLGNYGPNPAEDPVLLRYNEAGELEVMVIDRMDGTGAAFPGGMVIKGQENDPGRTATREAVEEALSASEYAVDFSRGKMVYQGKAFSARDTDDAWIVTRAMTVLISYEGSKRLKLEASDDAVPGSARWSRVDGDLFMKMADCHTWILQEAVGAVAGGRVQVTDDLIRPVKDLMTDTPAVRHIPGETERVVEVGSDHGDIRFALSEFPDAEMRLRALDHGLIPGAAVKVDHYVNSPQDVVQVILIMGLLKQYGARHIELVLEGFKPLAPEELAASGTGHLLSVLSMWADQINYRNKEGNVVPVAGVRFLPVVEKKEYPLRIERILYINHQFRHAAMEASRMLWSSSEQADPVSVERRGLQRIVEVPAGLNGQNIVLYHSTESGEKIEDLLLTLSALRAEGVASITLVDTYLGYARQDRRNREGEGRSAETILRTINSLVDHHFSVNVHYGKQSGLVNLKDAPDLLAVHNLNGFVPIAERMAKDIVERLGKVPGQELSAEQEQALAPFAAIEFGKHPLVIVGPDRGSRLYSQDAARELQRLLRASYGVDIPVHVGYLAKKRDSVTGEVSRSGEAELLDVTTDRPVTSFGGVPLRDVWAFVVDDITATGGTLFSAEYALVEKLGLSWSRVLTGVSHAVLSRGLTPFQTGLTDEEMASWDEALKPNAEFIDRDKGRMPPRAVYALETMLLPPETQTFRHVSPGNIFAYVIRRIIGGEQDVPGDKDQVRSLGGIDMSLSDEELRIISDAGKAEAVGVVPSVLDGRINGLTPVILSISPVDLRLFFSN